MKRSILFALSLVLLLPLAFTVGEAPATALTCQCEQEAFECQQSCQGLGAWCRESCNQDYQACLAGCP